MRIRRGEKQGPDCIIRSPGGETLIEAGEAQSGLSDAEKTAVHDQLERMLVNPYFSHSRRFPSFCASSPNKHSPGSLIIKERTLGIEIFGRPADYDTASDPIVRVTAAEIRKRIAQYYRNPATS